ncbi:Putative copper export protein [Tritonibacter multivorans]|uniref:Putative copper export protein n=1 Tax=Tritonibacter multivorans TaxID=928856 RepID=A0A0P1GB19_9RHOB|nr:CopD family protein [Tritonibacter multivorans]MDA7421989.1 CopD family protein [Tritonibacter multivorans]CUH78717.1 Putative copper export protein [Tritonibacter multivorans]SFD67942.1 putative copper resistance protein D [Tritonibacter multivorans]
MPDIWGLAAILAKFVLYVAAFGTAGLVIVRIVFAAATAPLAKRIQKQTLGLAVLTLLASVLGFALRGAALTGGADGMTDPEMLALLWQTPVGEALALRLWGAALIVAGLCIPRKGQSTAQWIAQGIAQWIAQGIVLAGALLVLGSFTQIGHIRGLDQVGASILLWLHLIGIALWIGVLPPLHYLSRKPEHLGEAAHLGHRFGQIAVIAVPALLMAGLVMGWMLIGSLAGLIQTTYGAVLLIKVALVAVLLGLAAANKLRFVPAMLGGDTGAAGHLARSIEIETAVVLLVLAITATLTSVLSLPG